MRWCARAVGDRLIGGSRLIHKHHVTSAMPRSRRAILTALNKDAALYGDTALLGDPHTALYRGAALYGDTVLLGGPHTALCRGAALCGDTALLGDLYPCKTF